jgi:hypothetical protein
MRGAALHHALLCCAVGSHLYTVLLLDFAPVLANIEVLCGVTQPEATVPPAAAAAAAAPNNDNSPLWAF